jgi:ATP-dependent Clp protease ATP-binding subunit ClpA
MELSTDDLSKIVDMRLNEFADQVHHNNVTVKVEPRVANFIVSHDTSDHGMNAMVIGRMISKKIAPLVSDAIFSLEDADNYNHTLTVDIKKDELVVRKRRRKKYQKKK